MSMANLTACSWAARQSQREPAGIAQVDMKIAAETMGLGAMTLKGIKRKGYRLPTPIQRRAIPLVMAGQDLVGMARTGSGKTAAFVIPLIERYGPGTIVSSSSGYMQTSVRPMIFSAELTVHVLRAVHLAYGSQPPCLADM